MDIGLEIETTRLLDGDCICDVLVKAPAETIASYFGKATLVFQAGKLLKSTLDNPESVVYVGKPRVSDWCYVEMNNSGAEDSLISLCKQAIFATKGNAPAVTSLSYATPISTAGTLSIALQAPAIALWGSDAVPFLGGGAIFDQSGQMREVYHMGTPEQLKQELNYLRDSYDGLEFDDQADESVAEDEACCYKYVPGQKVVLLQQDIIEVLHTKLKALQAAQPHNPLRQELSSFSSGRRELPTHIPDRLRQLLEPIYGTFETYAEALRQEMEEERVNKADIEAIIELHRQKWFGIEMLPINRQHSSSDDETFESNYEAIWSARITG